MANITTTNSMLLPITMATRSPFLDAERLQAAGDASDQSVQFGISYGVSSPQTSATLCGRRASGVRQHLVDALGAIDETPNHPASAIMQFVARRWHYATVEPTVHGAPLRPFPIDRAIARGDICAANFRASQLKRPTFGLPVCRTTGLYAEFQEDVNPFCERGYGRDECRLRLPQASAIDRGRSIGRVQAELRHFPATTEIDDVLAHPRLRLGGVCLRNGVGDPLVRVEHSAVGLRQQRAEDFERREQQKADRFPREQKRGVVGAVCDQGMELGVEVGALARVVERVPRPLNIHLQRGLLRVFPVPCAKRGAGRLKHQRNFPKLLERHLPHDQRTRRLRRDLWIPAPRRSAACALRG